MPTREEALQFMKDSRRVVPPPTDAARVEKFRRLNLRQRWVSPNLNDDELLAILQKIDQLPLDPGRRS